jgi:hypothetical protein
MDGHQSPCAVCSRPTQHSCSTCPVPLHKACAIIACGASSWDVEGADLRCPECATPLANLDHGVAGAGVVGLGGLEGRGAAAGPEAALLGVTSPASVTADAPVRPLLRGPGGQLFAADEGGAVEATQVAQVFLGNSLRSRREVATTGARLPQDVAPVGQPKKAAAEKRARGTAGAPRQPRKRRAGRSPPPHSRGLGVGEVLAVGARIHGNWLRDGTYFAGTVTAVVEQGGGSSVASSVLYTVVYSDGVEEVGVLPKSILVDESPLAASPAAHEQPVALGPSNSLRYAPLSSKFKCGITTVPLHCLIACATVSAKSCLSCPLLWQARAPGCT